MWNAKKVEGALFCWDKWRKSIVNAWYERVDLEQLNVIPLRMYVRQQLRSIGLVNDWNVGINIYLEIYWICCVVSCYDLDNPSSYDAIRVPNWLPIKYTIDNNDAWLISNNRVWPPIGETIDSKYEAFDYTKRSLSSEINPYVFWETAFPYKIELDQNHELYHILMGFRGRPSSLHVHTDDDAHYSDHLAVQCAALKYQENKTYTQIAKIYHLPSKHYYESRQSYVARYLVTRGIRLLESVGIDPYLRRNGV
jgi:hypothetical protein